MSVISLSDHRHRSALGPLASVQSANLALMREVPEVWNMWMMGGQERVCAQGAHTCTNTLTKTCDGMSRELMEAEENWIKQSQRQGQSLMFT